MAVYYKKELCGNNNPHWRGGKIEKRCKECGNIFYAIIANKNQKFCSIKCLRLWQIKNKKIKPIKKKRVFREYYCKNCGVKLNGKRKYCEKCYNLYYRAKRVIVFCKNCGMRLERRSFPSRPVPSLFCDKKCYSEYVRKEKLFVGENNSNWKGGIKPLALLVRDSSKNKKLIKKILVRDSYTCQICGQKGGDLEVDHIKKFADIMKEFLGKYQELIIEKDKYKLLELALQYQDFWNENNLRVLCRHCNWNKEITFRQETRTSM